MLIKFINDERGSISLFLIVIITALFFLNILLIDFSRMMTGKLISEKSVKAAIRSELSRFDQSLYKQYGLFAYVESNNNVFEEILISNLDNHNNGFSYNKFDLDNIKYELSFEQELVLLPVIKNQILEEMKYQAPISFQQSIYQNLEKPVEQVTDTIEYYNLIEEITDKFLTRNKLLRHVFDLQADANKLLPANLNELISVFSDKINLIATEELSTDEVKAIENELSKNVNLLTTEYHRNYSIFYNRIDTAKKQLADSKILNEEIADLLNQYDKSIDYKDTILSKEIYEEISDSLNLQASLFEDIFNVLNELSNMINLFSIGQVNPGEFFSILGAAQTLTNQYNNQFGNLNHADNWISRNANNFNSATAAINRYYDELLTESDKSLFSLKKLVNSLKTIASIDEVAVFIDNKYEEFLSFNKQDIQTKSAEIDLNVENINDTAQGIFLEVKPIVDNYLIQIRDSIYYEEYAFEKFDSLENILSQNTFELLINGIVDDDFASNIHISRQELEYVIYGNKNSSLNIAAVLRDIYLIRFFFNLCDALLNPAIFSSANPVIIMLEASTLAFKTSINDLALILKGDKLPLMKKVTAGSFGYIEYLKLLYLCRGTEEEKLLRQLALIESVTGINLKISKTYGVADVIVPMDLWFLPGLPSVTRLDSGIIETNYKSEYIIKQRIAYGY